MILYSLVQMNHKFIRILRQLRLMGLLGFCFVLVSVSLVLAQSAIPHFKFEAESGIRTGTAAVITDGNASGNQALQFASPATGPSGKKCVVSLHGKGGDGGAPWQNGDETWLFPTGNGDGGGWGPHHWEYATSTTYNQALSIINSALSPHSCGQITVIGFSNGAAMAAKIYCQGQNFSNRLVGVIVDDPVPDQVVDNCAPASDIGLRLVQSNDMNLWIGGGGFCPGGWTCQGNTYSRSEYASRIGASNPHISGSHSPVNDLYDAWMDPWWN
jgi:pimeloyl-ACP methyl ester carboxylesterase